MIKNSTSFPDKAVLGTRGDGLVLVNMEARTTL